jgi:hypothetical protein
MLNLGDSWRPAVQSLSKGSSYPCPLYSLLGKALNSDLAIRHQRRDLSSVFKFSLWDIRKGLSTVPDGVLDSVSLLIICVKKTSRIFACFFSCNMKIL